VRLVVHIGATKTASTYLQKCLGLNEDLLLKHGVYLPQAGRRSTSSNLNHHNLAWNLLEDRRFRGVSGDWEGLRAEVADTDADVVLLSSEAFARMASEERLRPMLSNRLLEIEDDVPLVYFPRDPLARINSMYAQTVKTFADPGPFDEYATKSIKSGFYNLEESFGFWYQGSRARFVAIRFDEFVKVGPLQSLLGVLGLEIPDTELTIPDDISNPSPGPIAVEAMRLLNAHLRVVDPHFSRRSTATMKLSQIIQRRASKSGWNDERYWGWEPDRAVWAADRLANSNQRFAQAVWGTSWPLELPLKRPVTARALVDVSTKTRKSVDSYVEAMTKRYLKLINRRPEDQTEEVVDVDDSTIDTDEAERAGLAVAKSQRMRPE
jgi:hypothetical protein